MKIIILAGGLGTRLSEETANKPKPMVLLDDKPILWHLMSIFSKQGFNDFVLALGYKSEVVKRWLVDLNELSGNIRIETKSNKFSKLDHSPEIDWKIIALETGLDSLTGKRIKICLDVFPNERVLVTYGDGLANINLENLINFHESHGKIATVTAVHPPARFGYMEIGQSENVEVFSEKNQLNTGWINGGFFILEPELSKYLTDDNSAFETSVLPKLVEDNNLMAYKHESFWQPMDTIREKEELGKLARLSTPPWLLGLDR
jgi:glucose-1-phosphate cytidylyltransferase